MSKNRIILEKDIRTCTDPIKYSIKFPTTQDKKYFDKKMKEIFPEYSAEKVTTLKLFVFETGGINIDYNESCGLCYLGDFQKPISTLKENELEEIVENLLNYNNYIGNYNNYIGKKIKQLYY